MQLTHTADDCLTCLFVSLYTERRILFCQLRQTDTQLIQILLSLRFYSDTNHRIGELHRLQCNRVILVTQGITCTDILETNTCTNITTTDYLHRVLLVRVHLEQTRDTFLLARTSIQYIRTSLHRTCIDTEEAQTTYIRVSSDLKCQSGQRLFKQRLASNNLVRIIRICTFDSRCIFRTRQISTNSIQQCLNTLVLERRTANHRVDLHRQSSLADSSLDFVLCDRSRIFKIFLHQSFITLSQRLQHLITPLFSLSLEFCRDLVHFVFSTHGLIMP